MTHFEQEPDKFEEKVLFVMRIYRAYFYGELSELLDYLKIDVPGDKRDKFNENSYLGISDRKYIAELIASKIEFNEVPKMIEESPPNVKKNGYELSMPFLGYYVTVDKRWNVKMWNKWDELESFLSRALRKSKPKYYGFKTYAILKSFLNEYDKTGEYEVSPINLISNAHNILDQNQWVRPWFNHFGDAMGAGIVFNTRSVKRGEMTILPEVIPLIRHVLAEFERENVGALDNIKRGKPPF